MIHLMAHCDICGQMISDKCTTLGNIEFAIDDLIENIRNEGASIFYENKFVCRSCIKKIVDKQLQGEKDNE